MPRPLFALRLLLLSFVFVVSFSPAWGQAGKKHALLIGINDYKASSVTDLKGCVNDIERMRGVLVGKYDFEPAQIVALKDSQASRNGIFNAFRDLTSSVRANDLVVVHYSGHGSRMRDSSGDETDGWDETIVPHDSRQQGVFDISDDELNGLLSKLADKTSNVVFILDSCHSGTATRGGAVARRAADDERTPPQPSGQERGGVEGLNDFRRANARYVLIAGSRPNELSNEFDVDGERRGALTYYLAQAMENATAETTYRDLIDEVGAQVTAMFPSQHPQMEGGRSDVVVFGDASRIAEPSYLAFPLPENRVRLDGGMVAGLTKNSVIEIYPPQTKKFAPPAMPLGRAKLTRVDVFDAEAELLEGAREVPPAARAVVRERSYPDFKLRVHIDGSVPAAMAGRLDTELRQFSFYERAPEEPSAHVLIRAKEGRIQLMNPDFAELSPSVALSDAGVVGRITEQVTKWARWFALANLKNLTSPLDLRFAIDRVGPGGTSNLRDGDRISFSVENRSERSVFITVLDLSSDGSISIWYPAFGEDDSLAPNQTLRREIELFVPEGREQVTDLAKVLVTDAPIDPRVFIQPAIRSAEASDSRFADDSVIGFIQRTAIGASRAGRPVRQSGWTTAERVVKIRKQGDRALGFLVHFEGARATDSARAVGEALPEFSVREFAPDGTIVEVSPSGDAAGTRGGDSVGQAWEEAYRLRAETGATRVEPAFEVDLSDWPMEDPPDTRGGIQRPNKPGAQQQPLWSLMHVRAPDAWRMLQDKGRRDGEEGKGIIVGHPDTGYRRHPEIWNADEERSSVLFSQGFDFYGGDSDALDELEEGVLANPGHGTKTGSVIVSGKGRQLPGAATEFVSGVAPGARIMPLRVNKSVVQFNPSRLAKAIMEASGDDRSRVKRKADVISISMGGVPTWALWRAVRAAEDRGVIVIAAAGNEVGVVVWPARFQEVVAVAASNVECGIWDGSSRGSAVDFTAPGESVWLASTTPAGVDAIAMGQGTSFATATTAGAAALWLDFHAGSPQLAELKRMGRVARTFRDLARATSWRPNAPPQGVSCKPQPAWKSEYHGAGILDVAKLLQQPLPATGSRGPELTLSDLPLFRSLFPDDASDELVRERYRRLVGSSGPQSGDAEIFEAEILYHYGVDQEVRAAIDQLTGETAPASAYADARRALLARDLSEQLRAALTRAGG